MDYIERFKKVAVLGAAGKMGSGILLLTAMEMTDLWLQDKDAQLELLAVDISPKGLQGLMKYLEAQTRRAAEKKTVSLRQYYADREDLIENGDIIEAYVSDVLSLVQTTTHLEDIYGASLVFEAIKEDPGLKVEILSKLAIEGKGKTWFFTNTSSIPIGELDEKANLDGKILGFHFYNPPAVQRLVELIPAAATTGELKEFATLFAKKLRKVLVPSNDFAGFVGNGHFMRDALFGIKEAERITDQYSLEEAIYLVNSLTQSWLVRPMGIFQLIDYVGIDVVSYIMMVMNPYLPDENLHSEMLEKYLDQGVKGGQFSSGAQKDGFFKYERGRPTAVYSLKERAYVPLDKFREKIERDLGEAPQKLNWKDVNFHQNKEDILSGYFTELKQSGTMGAEMARAYGLESKRIAELLVSSNVAASTDDVNKVLQTGFYHAYGPVNEYF